MRLTYRPEVTPADYKPEYFETSYAPLEERSAMEDVQVGSINTPHHSLTFTYV